eukprot:COSAG02_NODE_3531_length_6606_cov_67.718611_3_plen_197_part_00
MASRRSATATCHWNCQRPGGAGRARRRPSRVHSDITAAGAAGEIEAVVVMAATDREEVPDDVRAQLIAAAGSDEPSVVEEALRVARPFARSSALEKDLAAATAARDRLALEGTETARRLLQGSASNAEVQRAIIRFAPVLENAELQSLTRRLTDSLGHRGAAASPHTAAARDLSPPVIARYQVVHKAVARAGFEKL